MQIGLGRKIGEVGLVTKILTFSLDNLQMLIIGQRE